ncbi:MAG: type I DNA topoisomerase, partial [Candidatus Levybacteria bacterium CG10_big_fil_rev_8_21_14_0_10_36_7]
ITPKAIDEALLHPQKIDENLVAAQTGRRVLDRIVGYKLSPILWSKIKKRLSAGRVQSVALRLIVEREGEIEKFQTREFFRVFVTLSKKENNSPIEFELTKINSESIEKQEKIKLYDGDYTYSHTSLSETDANEIEKGIYKKDFVVTDVVEKEMRRNPSAPFITSTLQQDASRRFGYPSRRTMSLAQRLYEEGFITYHRTDSYNLSNDFLTEARTYIEKTFGKKYLPASPRVFKTKSKMAQEAHEAIRPTNLFQNTNEIESKLGADFAKLYDLIYRRALASQMTEAVFMSTRIESETKSDKTYTFQTNGRILKFDGFLKVWFYEEEEQIIPKVSISDKLDLKSSKVSPHNTTPPPRYNEASLIASLEKHGIGRPSTYAPIISTITARYYIEKKENRFYPTEIGTTVSNFLVKNFSDIDDLAFTASMEDELDAIAAGKKDWVPVIKNFYTPFEKSLQKAEKQDKIEVVEEKTGRICPKDKGDIIVKYGRFGKFYACANFPNCDFKESIVEDSGFICPRDKGKMATKRTRRGRTFYGCANYPKCDFAVWTKKELEDKAIKQEVTPDEA